MDSRPQPGTPATRFLETQGIAFVTHEYDYEARGGARHAAVCLGVSEHVVVKTLVMRTDRGRVLLVLMHGDRQVSAKRLAAAIDARRVVACSPDEALETSGYVVGGISPFGVRTTLPVYAESSIFDLPRIYINGGRRGLLLEIDPRVLHETLQLQLVSVARAP